MVHLQKKNHEAVEFLQDIADGHSGRHVPLHAEVGHKQENVKELAEMKQKLKLKFVELPSVVNSWNGHCGPHAAPVVTKDNNPDSEQQLAQMKNPSIHKFEFAQTEVGYQIISVFLFN